MNQEKIGKLIKKISKNNNLTQADFAKEMGVTYQAVSKWENGKNIPDIAILKEISNLFNVDIDEIISGEKTTKKEKKNNKLIYILISIILILVIITSILYFKRNKDDIDIKEITTTCEKFNVVGSLVHSNNKSYIRISNIEYCDEEDTVYKEIECILYEKNGNIINKITSCDKGYNVRLKDHLKEVRLSADDYNSICSVSKKDLYLEIIAVDSSDKTITYKVPLEVNDTCN